jgi:hypothetical protein
MREFTRRSRGLWVVVSFEARESMRNWKFVCASALGL